MKDFAAIVFFGSWLISAIPCLAQRTRVQRADTLRNQIDTAAFNSQKYGSESETNFSLLAGYQQGYYGFADLGVAINNTRRIGYHGLGMAAYAGSEAKIDKRTMIGPKIGFWSAGGVGGIGIGANLIYYTDFKSAAWCFRPEGGLGMDNWKVSYGYNFLFTNKQFAGVNTHLVSLAVLIRLKKIRESDEELMWNQRRLQLFPEEKRTPKGKDTLVTKSGVLLLGGITAWKYGFAEVGIAYYEDDQERYGQSGMVYLTTEILPGPPPIYGFKVGNFSYGHKPLGICGGMPVIYYTDFKSNSWSIRPEAGVHYKKLILLYGYNIFLARYRYSAIAHHQVSLLFGIPLKKYKDDVVVVDKYE